MDQTQPDLERENTDLTVRHLLEEIAGATEDLYRCIESIQELAGEIVSRSTAGLPHDRVVRIQSLDSLCQRIAVLPELLRSLRGAVPADLRLEDAETLRAFSASMRSYQGSAACYRPEDSDSTGDCEIWVASG